MATLRCDRNTVKESSLRGTRLYEISHDQPVREDLVDDPTASRVITLTFPPDTLSQWLSDHSSYREPDGYEFLESAMWWAELDDNDGLVVSAWDADDGFYVLVSNIQPIRQRFDDIYYIFDTMGMRGRAHFVTVRLADDACLDVNNLDVEHRITISGEGGGVKPNGVEVMDGIEYEIPTRKLKSNGAGHLATDQFRSWTLKELFEATEERLDYLARPLAARGLVTILDGLPKLSGKTRLILLMLLDCFLRRPFLGKATKPVVVVYVTEEHRTTFKTALKKLKMTPDRLPNVELCTITRNEWMGMEWADLLAQVAAVCQQAGANLLVWDTLYRILGLEGDEISKPGKTDKAIGDLSRLAAELNMAVIVGRHERKSEGDVSVSGIGSIAASGAADIVAALRRKKRSGKTTRQLEVIGRGTGNGTYRIEIAKQGDGYRYMCAEPQQKGKIEQIGQIISDEPG